MAVDHDRLGEMDQRNVVSSVLKACSLLECFRLENPEQTLAELAQGSGLNKTTVHRLLQTLVVAGWLQRGEHATYRLTMQVHHLGAVAESELSLRTEAEPQLQRLADAFGDTAYLMVPYQDKAMCVALVAGDSPLRIAFVGVGTTFGYHAGAGPVVMAAFSPDIEAKLLANSELPPYTSRTTPREEVAERLAQVRDDGFAISDGDLIDGVTAVGAPIFGSDGAIAGTISLGGSANRFGGARVVRIVDGVRDAAAAVSRKLGHQ